MKTQRQKALQSELDNIRFAVVKTCYRLPVEALLKDGGGWCFEINTSLIKILPEVPVLEEQFLRFAVIAGLRERDLQDYSLELHISPGGPCLIALVDEEVRGFFRPQSLFIEIIVEKEDRLKLIQHYTRQLSTLLTSRCNHED